MDKEFHEVLLEVIRFKMCQYTKAMMMNDRPVEMLVELQDMIHKNNLSIHALRDESIKMIDQINEWGLDTSNHIAVKWLESIAVEHSKE